MSEYRDHQPLTKQQAEFCRHYARDMNGARAYAAAYPSRSPDNHARSEYARRLLRKPWILDRIADLRRESRSEWCARAKAPEVVIESPVAAADPPQAHAVLERLALLAFDTSQIDFIRLAALRCLDAGLEDLACAVSTDNRTPIIRVAISVEVHPPCEESPNGSPVGAPREGRAQVESFAGDGPGAEMMVGQPS